MIEVVKRFIRAQQFQPGPLGILVNPFFLARRGLARAIVDHSRYMGGRLLDVGCGTKPYANLFCVSEYVGLELDTPLARARGAAECFYDGVRFPFADESFDCVLCNQVLEHVFTPDSFLAEITRVLRPGGRLLLTVPFVWDEHEQPHDYARYASFGLRALVAGRGLKILSHTKIVDDVSLVFQLLNAYLFKVTHARSGAVNTLTCGLLMAPLSLVGLLAGKLLPANPDLYLDQLLLAEKAA